MKRNILFLFACMFIHTSIWAQNPNNKEVEYSLMEDGITWFYNLYEVANQGTEWAWQTVMGDTLIRGHIYKKVYFCTSDQNVKPGLGELNGLFRQEGSKIYIPSYRNIPLLQDVGNETLLYDFSLEQGDLFGAQTEANNTFKVNNVEEKTYGERIFKLMHLTGSPNINETWIANVGSQDHYFLDPFGYYTISYYDFKLINLSKGEEVIYQNPFFSKQGNRSILFAHPNSQETYEHSQELTFEFRHNTLFITGYMYANCCGNRYLQYDIYPDSIHLKRYEEEPECDCEGVFEMRTVSIPNCTGNSYRVVLADYHGTHGLDTIIRKTYIEEPTEIANTSTQKIRLYPNPIKEQAVLEFNNPDKEVFTFELIEATGKAVLSRKGITTDRILIKKGNLSSGIYFYRLFNSKQEYSDKLLIE